MKEWYIIETGTFDPEVRDTPPKNVAPEHVFHVVEKKYIDTMKAQNDSLLKQIAKLQATTEQQAVEIGSLDRKHEQEKFGHKEFSRKYHQLRHACDWLIEVLGGVGLPRWREAMMKEYSRRLSLEPKPKSV